MTDGKTGIDMRPAGGGEAEGLPRLVVKRPPDKRRYRPGEGLDFSGLVVELGDRDVTAACSLDAQEGEKWGASERSRAVTATYASGGGALSAASFKLERKRGPLAPLLIAFLVVVAALVGALWYACSPHGDTGSYFIPQGDMTDEEAQALVNEMTEKSRIDVSVASRMALAPDGSMRVNFIVAEPNNGLAERLEVEQGGEVVFRSGVVEPGNRIEWAAAQGAETGPATATVYAVRDGQDTGNPVSAEVQIVDYDPQGASGATLQR